MYTSMSTAWLKERVNEFINEWMDGCAWNTFCLHQFESRMFSWYAFSNNFRICKLEKSLINVISCNSLMCIRSSGIQKQLSEKKRNNAVRSENDMQVLGPKFINETNKEIDWRMTRIISSFAWLWLWAKQINTMRKKALF